MDSMWSVEGTHMVSYVGAHGVMLEGARDMTDNIPVNVRPNTSSSLGTSSFGVVVLVIDNCDGSISFRLDLLAWSACML